jgi:type VI secretion system protein ImpH
VADRLFREPYAFGFFQAARLLGQLAGDGGRADAVRFRVWNSLNFPPSTIQDLEPAAGPDRPPVMTVAFLGLTGPSGVLPRQHTELMMRQEREAKGPEKHALRDWFDLFNHRVIRLFQQAWEKYRYWVGYERGSYRGREPGPFPTALFSLIGLGTPALRDRLRVTHRPPEPSAPERVLARVDDLVLLYYGGLFAQRHRTAAGLEALLHDYFHLPVRLEQFQGQWLRLEKGNQSRLGSAGGNCDMGVNLVAGERVWDVQSRVRVRVGPLAAAQFQALLPDRTPGPQRKRFFQLVHLTRLYLGMELDFDVQLQLRPEDVPECRLPEATADGPRLGWDTWCRSQMYAEPVGDAVFDGDAVTRL